ncbi:MAG: 3'(2'),5'-bisphosphate nucleotidase CysQ [Planctomycetes bacterium]|nr:3'(2'),5'-bisphosphate nucleotidase CysQ [Planctomycetota bacterium]
MHERELEIALAAARLAGQHLVAEYERFKAIPNAPADITTDADRQAQDIIIEHIGAHFPGDAFCAEEQTAKVAGKPSTGQRLWIIDPIDGTRGFAQKNGEFSVMIGFVEGGETVAGLVAQPASGRLTYATRGKGCWRKDGDAAPVRCEVAGTTELSKSTLVQSRSRTPGKASKTTAAIAPAHIVETYSAGIKLALVARGEVDIYLNTYTEFHDWDICAGHILVTEAGGKVSGLKGETLRYGLPGAWQRHGLLATNGKIHDAALDRLRSAG